jgi:Flp pilus assembly protein TadG
MMPLQSEGEAAMPYETVDTTRRAAGRIPFAGLRPRSVWRGLAGRAGGRRGEQGAAVMEMALSMIVLLTLIFGLIEMCLALYTFHYVSDAAREGSRYAIVHGSTCTVSGVSCTMTSAQIQTYVQNLGYPGIQSSNMTVTTTYSTYPAGGTCPCNLPGDLATVTAKYAFTLNIPFLRSQSLNLTSTSAMVISQ